MNFKSVTLGEISIDNKGDYGIGASAVEYSENLPTYLRITDINDDGTLNKTGMKSVDDENANKYILQPNDIVFARTGNSTGKSYFYESSDGELVYAGFLIKFSLDPLKVNPRYMKYYTLSSDYKGWINSFNTGSTRGNINAKTYANMSLNLPSRAQQNLLVDTLEPLTNKIDLNNQTISSLEEIASTLFKHWFVDFEFPDKKGNPYKSSGGKMVESELGEIPEGWEVKQLKDITNYSNKAFNPKKENAKKVAHFSLPAFDSKTFPVIDETESIKSNKYYIDDSSIMVSKMNPNTPRIWLPNISKIYENVCSSEFIVLKSTNQNKKSFIYELCKSDKFTNFLISNATGSTNSRQRVTPSMAIGYTFPWNENKVEEYGEMIKNKHLLILELREQNINLLSLRDTLLPKLISGEIELPTEEEV